MSTEKTEEGWTEVSLEETTPGVPNPTPEVKPEPPQVEAATPETPQDEDLGKRAQKRITTLSRKLKDVSAERDALAAQAEKARQLEAELEELRKQQAAAQQGTADVLKQTASEKLEMAKRQLKAAYNEADPDKIVEANSLLAKATLEVEALSRWKPPPAPTPAPKPAVPTPQKLPEAAQEWLDKNPWYGRGPRQDRIAAVMATEIGDTLIQEGWDVNDSSYYEELDRRLVEELPRVAKLRQENPVVTKSPVASTSRTASPNPAGRGPSSVRLSAEEVELAHRLGVDLKTYAKRKAQLGSAGQGYTVIE